MRFCLFFLGFITILSSFGQSTQNATISGQVLDENGQPLPKVSVIILGRQSGISTNDSGLFAITLKAGRAMALEFSFTGYKTRQQSFYLSPGEKESIVVVLQRGETTLENVTISNKKDRQLSGLIAINPKQALLAPAPIGGIENLIKIQVGDGNELSSQYKVRGGNYDENLVYINDFEVFRPYLIRNGQQEGLSFINPELARNVSFYNGGFQARYGDKMSSVLDVEYKQPVQSGGSAYIGLLEQGAHLEGVQTKKRITYLVGVRNRSLRNLLGSQETKGNYVPSSSDLQGLLTWQPNSKWQLDLLGNLSNSKFELEPLESQQTTSVYTPLFSSNIGLDIYFEGREKDSYQTRMVGLSATRTFSKRFKLKGMLSYFNNLEQENINIAGSYLFGDRNFDKSSSDFGLITNPLGAGTFLNYARNQLNVRVINASVKGTLDRGTQFWQFGSSIEQNSITDNLAEFEYQDSAGYSLPYRTGPLNVYRSRKGETDLNITRITGYVQNNLVFNTLPGYTLQAGIRYNYNSLNSELLVSPRVNMSYAPVKWKKDVVFKASAGLYSQPPFYREMRRYDGSVNRDLKAQRSTQVTGGLDYSFSGFKRPMRLSVEGYYKNMTNLVPYDIDNVRLRYFGENMARGYAYGVETRLFGELVKDAESWVSFGVMKTMENLDNDFYRKYTNKSGEVITAETKDQVATDSQRVDIGWLRRPTDRRINFGLFFSDYLTTNKNFKVYLQTLFGTNLPYNIPGNTRYRNALEIPSYIRADIGFSYQLLNPDKSMRRSHDPFRNLNNMWLSFEVFNLLDRANTISYQLIKDFANNTFTIPNRLTPRLLNLKYIVRW